VSNGTSVTIIGNLTRDPEERVTKNGETKLDFSVAASRRWKNRNDEWEEETSYFDVTAWSELAKNSGITLKKGTRVIIVGRLKQESWNDKNTGDKRSKIAVHAEDIGPSLRKAYIQEIVKTGGQSNTGSAPRQPAFDDEEPF
jgi:single-strand DNA-binding protein